MNKLGCRQSQKVVPKVYKGLQSSFVSLAGLDQVGHPPRGTSVCTGTLDWGPMWSGPSPHPPNITPCLFPL